MKIYSITILRVFCLFQVFFLHYFAGVGLTDMIWIFSIAVPVFLLVSGYTYGLKFDTNTIFGKDFLLKRFKSLASVYYPFIFIVYIYYVVSDSGNAIEYTKSFAAALLFLTNVVNPLPGCGHLWFMQILALCYLSLAIATKFTFLQRWFSSYIGSLLMFLLVVLAGFIYRGGELVFLFFYLWIFYNAKRISSWNVSSGFLVLIILVLLAGYYLLSFPYEKAFKIAIYLRYIQTCIMAMLTIKLFTVIFNRAENNKLVTWFGAISMEFYLIHHLFVFNTPIYISLPVTILLSVLLTWISKKVNVGFEKIYYKLA